MANLCIVGLEKLKGILLADANALLAAGGKKLLEEKAVRVENVPADLADENRSTVYPAVYVYAARMDNVLRSKFAGFSGPIRLVADVRCTGERYEGLEEELTSYVEAVTTAVAGSAGPWAEGLVYSGAYTVKFEPVKLGGRNFIQSARVELEVEGRG